MRCEQVQEIIVTDYMDERMDASGRRSVEEHLSACQACREFLAAAKSAEDIIRRPVMETLSPLVWENIREKIEAQPAGWRGFFAGSAWRPAGIFAASLAVAIFTVGVLMPSGGSWRRGENPAAQDAALLSYLADDGQLGAEDRPYQTIIEDFFGPAGTFSG